MRKKKVLVVDDDPYLVNILTLNLLGEGFEVLTAFDGVSAIIRAHKEKPDLILLDIMMPAGDGFSVAEALKTSRVTESIPIVFVSALPKKDMEERAKAVGAIHYFAKPFNVHLLTDYIKSSLRMEEARTLIEEAQAV